MKIGWYFQWPNNSANTKFKHKISKVLFISPFKAVGELIGCVQGRGLGARLVFRGLSCWEALLMVLILDAVYDSHLQAVLESLGVINCSCGNYRLWAQPISFPTLWENLWAVFKIEISAQACLAFQGLSCWEASVTLYLWFRF